LANRILAWRLGPIFVAYREDEPIRLGDPLLDALDRTLDRIRLGSLSDVTVWLSHFDTPVYPFR